MAEPPEDKPASESDFTKQMLAIKTTANSRTQDIISLSAEESPVLIHAGRPRQGLDDRRVRD